MANRYANIKIERSSLGRRYYAQNIYPDIPVSENDLYVITTATDRLDLLASDIYGDPFLYWIIASANALPGDSLTPPPGQQLRIPTDIETIINNYISANENPE
jgi:hypothetical protein